MYRLCYRIGANGNGDYVSIDFIGNYLKEDKTIFDAIAPYVEDESYIQMKGGDDEVWRWIFKNGKCIEKQTKITFDY